MDSKNTISKSEKKRRRYLTKKQKERLLDAYGWTCPGLLFPRIECGEYFYVPGDAIFDHYDQVSLSGDNSFENFQPLCPRCNDIKTYGPGGEKRICSAGSDANKRAKLRRKNRVRPKKLIQSRGFQPGHRQLKSRGFVKGKNRCLSRQKRKSRW
jgi:hypothetical protein